MRSRKKALRVADLSSGIADTWEFRFLSRVGDIETGTSSSMSVWMTLGGRKKELKLEVRHEVVTKAS